MKTKLILALLAMLLVEGVSFASQSQVQFCVSYSSTLPSIPHTGKSPASTPEVLQDGHELAFKPGHSQYTLTVVQEDTVIYSAVVLTSTATITLPSWLCGDATLILFPEDSNYYFYGDITLNQ